MYHGIFKPVMLLLCRFNKHSYTEWHTSIHRFGSFAGKWAEHRYCRCCGKTQKKSMIGDK